MGHGTHREPPLPSTVWAICYQSGDPFAAFTSKTKLIEFLREEEESKDFPQWTVVKLRNNQYEPDVRVSTTAANVLAILAD
jgi:hypothetical protein